MNINLLDPASFASGHPFDQYAWLRANAPCYWHEEPGGGGFWAVTRQADIRAIGLDPEVFSSEPTIMIADPDPEMASVDPDHKMMLMMDPPMHTEYRKLISREFTQGPAVQMAPWIRDFARDIVDAAIESSDGGREPVDFVSEIAGEMPSYVIAKLMGLPLEDGRKLYELTEIIHTSADMLPAGAQADAVAKMFEYGSHVIAEKRPRPTDDLASRLLHAEVDGRRLDDMDFLLFFMLLVDAGGDTTRNLVGSGLLALLDHPDAFNWLRQDLDGRLASTRDELLRWCSPVIYMRRTATRDTEIAGQRIRAGDKVVLYYGAGNRDADAFEAPDIFDPSRRPNRHVAFGVGTHICMGQHVARIEIDELLREVFTRLTDFEVDGAPQWLASNFISGPRALRVRFRVR